MKSFLTYLDLPSEADGYLGFTDEFSSAMSALPNTELVYGSVLDLPFGDNIFDMALCIEVIEHIDDDEEAVSEICRVLKKGGVALFTTPNGEVVPNENRSTVDIIPLTCSGIYSINISLMRKFGQSVHGQSG